ncbi:DUF1190 domain-containing protein [Marinobacter sp. C2H3]|uniref:DUF1190 domain-containing protein n=1 Tax=Marinobacter sp. C2H3 TaxID=3119003 RepID=UPI00300F2733
MAAQEGISATLKTRSRRQKRSQAATLVLMGATPFVVLAYDPLHIDVRVFQNLAACQQALPSASDYCNALSREAASRHPTMAPRYTSRAQCDTDFAHIINEDACESGWCSADNLINCEQTGDGHYRPPFSGFMVDQSVLTSGAEGGRPNPSKLSQQQLQPVYEIPDNALHRGENSDSGSSYGYHPLIWHYVTANGQYLGDKGLSTPVTLARTQLTSRSGKAYNGSTRRGGFGATALRTMQAARS